MAAREFDGEPYVDDTPTLAWSMETEGMHVNSPAPVLNTAQREDVTLADIYEQNEEILGMLREIRDFTTALQTGIAQIGNSNNPMMRMLAPMLGNLGG